MIEKPLASPQWRTDRAELVLVSRSGLSEELVAVAAGQPVQLLDLAGRYGQSR